MSRPPSIIRSSALYRRNPAVLTQHQDNFPLLDFKEIAICLQSCDFRALEELVLKPTSLYIKTLLEQIIDLFLGVTTETMHRKASSLGKESVGDFGDENDPPFDPSNPSNGSNPSSSASDDTSKLLLLLVLSKIAQKFLVDCGVHDFSLADIMRPDPFRIRRILSAIVNYAKFREEHSGDCEELLVKSEGNMDTLNQRKLEATQLQDKILRIQLRLNVDIPETSKVNHPSFNDEGDEFLKATLQQINAYNSKLENELKKLKKTQVELIVEHTKYKNEKNRLVEKVEDLHFLISELNKEVEKLKRYLVLDLSVVRRVNTDLRSNLEADQKRITESEQLLRDVVVLIELFLVVEQELKGLFRLLEEVLADLGKEEQALGKLVKYQDFLDQQSLESNDLNRQIQQLQRQSHNIDEKTTRIRQQAKEKSQEAREKLAKLTEDYSILLDDRKEKEEELVVKRGIISDLEKKMVLLQKLFENESKEAQQEVQQLNSHIRVYLSEMSKRLD